MFAKTFADLTIKPKGISRPRQSIWRQKVCNIINSSLVYVVTHLHLQGCNYCYYYCLLVIIFDLVSIRFEWDLSPLVNLIEFYL
jgi:hypothetical protein